MSDTECQGMTVCSDITTEDLERQYARDVAVRAVTATLDMLADSAHHDHDDMGEVLHMLSRVLRNPEVLT